MSGTPHDVKIDTVQFNVFMKPPPYTSKPPDYQEVVKLHPNNGKAETFLNQSK